MKIRPKVWIFFEASPDSSSAVWGRKELQAKILHRICKKGPTLGDY